MTSAALALLWILATVDGAFIGYRDAAGHSAIIDKRRYYRDAMARGAVAVQLPALIAAGGAAIATLASADPATLRSAWGAAAVGMLLVYVPYALAILAAMGVGRAARSVDVRSAVHLAILGPFTLIRPAVVVAGAAAGALAAPRPEVVAMEILLLAMMLGMEPIMAWRHRHFFTGR